MCKKQTSRNKTTSTIVFRRYETGIEEEISVSGIWERMILQNKEDKGSQEEKVTTRKGRESKGDHMFKG